MMLKQMPTLLALIVATLFSAAPLMAKKPATNPNKEAEKPLFDEATHKANVAKYGQSYLPTFKEIKEDLEARNPEIAKSISNSELLAVSFAIESSMRPILEDKIESKANSAEASVPSLFNGMMIFAAGLGFLAVFCLRKTMVQSVELRKLQTRLEEIKNSEED